MADPSADSKIAPEIPATEIPNAAADPSTPPTPFPALDNLGPTVSLTPACLSALTDHLIQGFEPRFASTERNVISNQRSILDLEARMNAKYQDILTQLNSETAKRLKMQADFTNLEGKVNELDSDIRHLKAKVNDLEDENYDLKGELEKREQYSRRMNVRLENIVRGNDAESAKQPETDDELLTKIRAELGKVDVELKTADVVRLHRLGEPRQNKRSGKFTQPAIIKLVTWRARQQLLTVNKKANTSHKAHNAAVRVHHDLTPQRYSLHSYATDKCRTLLNKKFNPEQQKTLQDKDKIFAFITPNCELRVRCGGRVHKYDSEDEFNRVIDQQWRH